MLVVQVKPSTESALLLPPGTFPTHPGASPLQVCISLYVIAAVHVRTTCVLVCGEARYTAKYAGIQAVYLVYSDVSSRRAPLVVYLVYSGRFGYTGIQVYMGLQYTRYTITLWLYVLRFERFHPVRL